jgi:hypothetical protein
MNDKIEVVANDTADGVVALLDTWNAEVNSVSVADDPDEFCIDSSVILTANEFV